MKLRNAPLFAFLALLLAGLSACGTMRRAGKDLGVVVISPILIPYAGGTDTVATSQEVKNGLGGSAATEVLAFIPAFVFHTVKHALYTVIHAVDFCFFPIYGLADLHPYGPEIEPLDYYQNTWFDESKDDKQKGTDAQSGESAAGGR